MKNELSKLSTTASNQLDKNDQEKQRIKKHNTQTVATKFVWGQLK